jgi:flavodoxin
MTAAQAIFTTVNGSTRKIARRATAAIAPGLALHDLAEDPRPARLAAGLLILFCPTYGDEELPPPIDRLSADAAAAPARFVICELGNFYGYDSASFGALKILKARFEARGGTAFAPHLSLDAMPRPDWDTLERWCRQVRAALPC